MPTTIPATPPEEAAAIARRAVSRFRGYLALIADLCVTEERVQLIRETTDEYEIDPDDPNLCKDCLEYPAVNAGRCFGCLSGRTR